MRQLLRVVLLAGACVVATVIAGWWSVPVLGAIWGVIARRERGAGWTAALAAGIAWTSLLLWTALRGSVAALAAQVGGLVGAPGFVLVLMPVGLAMLLAGCAGRLGWGLAGGERSQREGDWR